MPLFGGSKSKKPKAYINSIELDQSAISAGQEFTGRVNVFAGRSPLLIKELNIQLIGIAKSKYVTMKSNTVVKEIPDTRQRIYASEKFTLSNHQLPKGDHDLEFSLTAPKICPPSLEETSLYFVRYNLHVHLYLDGNTKEKHKKLVKVVGASWRGKYSPVNTVHFGQSASRANLVQQVTLTHVEHKVTRTQDRVEDETYVKTVTNNLPGATGSIPANFVQDPDPDIHPVQVMYWLQHASDFYMEWK